MSRPTLSESRGPLTDFEEKLEGADGDQWLVAFKLFLRKQNPWPEPPAVVNVLPQPAVKLTFVQAMEKAYGLLDMSVEYAEFVGQFGNAQTPGKWTLAMVQAPIRDEKGKTVGHKLTAKSIIAALKGAGSNAGTWYNDPDMAVPDNARNCNQKGSYFLDLQQNEDPDPELAGKSQSDLKKSKKDKVSVGHITWLERWFLELVHFLMTWVNMDKNGIWTICAGSLDSHGDVPCIYFSHVNGKVYGSNCFLDDSNAELCARAAVPRKPKRVSESS